MAEPISTREAKFEFRLSTIRLEIAPLERFIHIFAEYLDQPLMEKGELYRGYRYVNPDVRHFCLLKAARAVSGLNAGIELVRAGYVQEIAVLMRTVIECTTHIEFVLPIADRDEKNEAHCRGVCQSIFCR